MSTIINNETIWYLVRSSGTVAYLFLAASTIWGLVISSRFLKEIVPGPLSLAMHNYLSWNAIGLTVLHAILLLFTGFMDYSIINLLVPFTGPYSPFWVGIGIIGLYLMILTTLTFYVRSRISYRAFHVIHYLTYAAFVMSLLHSWFAGTDTPALEMTYLVTGLLVLFLTVYRILEALSSRKKMLANDVLVEAN
ncbi:MAG: ferric reductase-like transmembrane domain-containing protein [Ardenticatenaceae bacterium]|nr:ferric reductase-like transmembrane domain-containing protein [Anaerolineales bacterium]MCB8921886.1 ferric reductase-like transmembrane domain-containing protein [Ardenticatenaceae bacterium]MCB8992206.1 ferric reductase-like transmembrane domain-containing protein [Ardenticatenaceae bacterium]